MIFQHFMLDTHESNAYLAGCAATREAVLIDCGCFDQRITAFVEEHGLKVTVIFITHNHWDHNGGLAEFLKAFPEARAIGQAISAPADRTLAMPENGELRIGEMVGHILKTPGHTSDSLSLHFPSEKLAFTGDALFAGSIGGTSSEVGKRQLQECIHRLILTLPEDTEILPGHGPATTVAVEKKFNPLL